VTAPLFVVTTGSNWRFLRLAGASRSRLLRAGAKLPCAVRFEQIVDPSNNLLRGECSTGSAGARFSAPPSGASSGTTLD